MGRFGRLRLQVRDVGRSSSKIERPRTELTQLETPFGGDTPHAAPPTNEPPHNSHPISLRRGSNFNGKSIRLSGFCQGPRHTTPENGGIWSLLPRSGIPERHGKHPRGRARERERRQPLEDGHHLFAAHRRRIGFARSRRQGASKPSYPAAGPRQRGQVGSRLRRALGLRPILAAPPP